MKPVRLVAVIICLALAVAAQQSPAPAPTPSQDAIEIAGAIEQSANILASDLQRFRVEKWKGDREMKQQAIDDAASVQRNITTALPNILNDVRNRPDDLTLNLKLYRNLSALHDVLVRLTYYANMYGSREDAQLLRTDAEKLDSSRPALGKRIETMATNLQNEVSRMRAALAQANAAPPKKIIVDDAAPKKSAPKKKKPASTATADKTQTP